MKTILIGLYIILQCMAIILKLLWGDEVNWGWEYFFIPTYIVVFFGFVYWIYHVIKINKSVLK
jgi:hypothetical protein